MVKTVFKNEPPDHKAQEETYEVARRLALVING
jgi:hypothetical protein